VSGGLASEPAVALISSGFIIAVTIVLVGLAV
jgi:hypothetical protein